MAERDETVVVRDEEGVRRFVERMAMSMAEWGFARMSGRVLLTLMTSDARVLSAAQLAEATGASPSAISVAVRQLTLTGLVIKEPMLGARQDGFRMPDDAWYEGMLAKDDIYRKLCDLADEGLAVLGPPDSPSARRMADMRDFYAFVRTELTGILSRWQTHKDARDEAAKVALSTEKAGRP